MKFKMYLSFPLNYFILKKKSVSYEVGTVKCDVTTGLSYDLML